MSSDGRAKEHTDVVAVKTQADILETEPHTSYSDPEKQGHALNGKIAEQLPPQDATATGDPVVEPLSNTPSQQLDGWRLYAVQIAVCLALFLGAIDASIVATALVTIGREFNNFIQLQWIVLAFILTELGFSYIFSRISDIIGRKWASIIAVGILTASSLACGLSQNLNQLIVFRAFQGLGGAGVYSMPFIVLPEITPPKKFGLLSGLSGITFVCSSILGPTLGGIITTHSTWRWIFFFNVPIGIFIVALMLFSWPKSQTRPAGKLSWREFDVIGCVLSLVAVVFLVFALQEAGADAYPWSSRVIITTLTLSGAAAVTLFFWIWYLSSGRRFFTPLFPARVMLHRVLAANAAASTLAGYVMFTVLIELPQRFQLVNSSTPQTAGIDLLPFLGSTAVASGLCGWLSSQKNRSFYTMTISGVFTILGTALLSTINSGSAIPRLVYLYQILLGLGLGGTIVSTILMVKLNASEEDAASAQGIQSEARLLGGNLGLALATIILNNHLEADLKGVLTPMQITDVQHSPNAVAQFTPREVAAVAASFGHAFKTQMQACAGVAVALLLFALMTWQRHPPSFVGLGKTVKK